MNEWSIYPCVDRVLIFANPNNCRFGYSMKQWTTSLAKESPETLKCHGPKYQPTSPRMEVRTGLAMRPVTRSGWNSNSSSAGGEDSGEANVSLPLLILITPTRSCVARSIAERMKQDYAFLFRSSEYLGGNVFCNIGIAEQHHRHIRVSSMALAQGSGYCRGLAKLALCISPGGDDVDFIVMNP